MQTTQRFHGLDLLRAFAMSLGVVLHAPVIYQLPDVFPFWEVYPQGPGLLPLGIELIIGWIHQWRMPAFFILAGFFGLMILERKGERYFAWDRFVRILLCLFVFAAFYDLLSPPFNGELGHLWFLWFLGLISLVYVPLFWLFKRLRLEALAQALSWPAQRVWTMGLYLVPLIPLTVVGRGADGAIIIPLTYWSPDMTFPFLHFMVWFGIGFALYRRRAVLERLCQPLWIAVHGLVAVASMLGYWLFMDLDEGVIVEGFAFASALSALSTLAWCLFFFGLSQALLKSSSKFVTYFVELSYPVYLLHVFPAVAISSYLVILGLNPWINFLITILGSGMLSILLYYILIKFTPLNWLVNGYKKSWFKMPGRRAKPQA